MHSLSLIIGIIIAVVIGLLGLALLAGVIVLVVALVAGSKKKNAEPAADAGCVDSSQSI